ncbi:MAG: Fe-S-cluster containining protein [Candidatus Woesearchaeota archaeon]|jgi:Fe-S-cluster containining protein
MTSCQAKCCKRGKIIVDNATLIKQNPDLGTVREDGLREMSLTPQCKFLKESKCTVYENRPQICRDYPLFDRYKKLFVASSCEGYQKGLLDEHLEKLKQEGFEIIVQ